VKLKQRRKLKVAELAIFKRTWKAKTHLLKQFHVGYIFFFFWKNGLRLQEAEGKQGAQIKKIGPKKTIVHIWPMYSIHPVTLYGCLDYCFSDWSKLSYCLNDL
jgi:hypothetical protein